MGLSLLCGVAAAAEPSAEVSVQRVTPVGGSFSIEFPAAPTCDPKAEVPDCVYEDPQAGWLLRASYSTVEFSGAPAEYLQKHLAENAEAGAFQIDQQEATRVGEAPALDYRFKSIDGSAYRSEGRLVLIGKQLVEIEVGGNTLPAEDVIQRFVQSIRVSTPEPQPGPAPSTAPSPEAPQAPPQAVQTAPVPIRTEPSPVLASIAGQVQAWPLKMGTLQYQSIQEKIPGEGMPWRFSVGKTRRVTQHKRDKTRDAFVITETGSTQEGKFENRFWVDAKTLLPYRWEGRTPDASMRMEVSNGSLHAERKGASAATFDQPVGNTPLWFPGAPLELALSTLPLARGFMASVQVLDPEGLDTGKPFSTWQVSVPFAGPVKGLGSLKQEVAGYQVELIERSEEKEPRKISVWIENEKARRVLQVESLAPSSRGGGRSIQTIQASR